MTCATIARREQWRWLTRQKTTIAISPREMLDSNRSIVFQLLGQITSDANYVATECDLVEFTHWPACERSGTLVPGAWREQSAAARQQLSTVAVAFFSARQKPGVLDAAAKK